MGHVNLEVFKFGMYVMFPIGWMYYFGTNLDGRFNVPEFWPSADQAHRLPADREEVDTEVQRIVSVQRKVKIMREQQQQQQREREEEEERRRIAAEGGGLQEISGQGQQQQQQGTGKRWWLF